MYHSARKQEQVEHKLILPDDVNYLVLSDRVIKTAPYNHNSIAVLCIDLIGATHNDFACLEDTLQTLLDDISVDNFVAFSDTGQLWLTLYTPNQLELRTQIIRLHNNLTHADAHDEYAQSAGCFTGVCFAPRDGSNIETLLRKACAAAIFARRDANQQGELRFFRPSMLAS